MKLCMEPVEDWFDASALIVAMLGEAWFKRHITWNSAVGSLLLGKVVGYEGFGTNYTGYDTG